MSETVMSEWGMAGGRCKGVQLALLMDWPKTPKVVQCEGGLGWEDEERGRRGRDLLHFPALLTGLNCWEFPHF